MPCESVTFPGGQQAIVCSSRKALPRCACGARAPLLCDWKVGGGKTCDRPVCSGCSTSPAPGKDLCRIHAQEWADWKAAPRRVRAGT